MDDPAKQTSSAPQNGPTKSKEVIDPIVDDLAELFDATKETVKNINDIWLELKRLQVGAQGGGIPQPPLFGLWIWSAKDGVTAWRELLVGDGMTVTSDDLSIDVALALEDYAIDTCPTTITFRAVAPP